MKNQILLLFIIIFSINVWAQNDTIKYDQLYTGSVKSYSKDTVVFEGNDNMKIRFGYGLFYGGNILLLSPSSNTIIESSGENAEDLSLSETGMYKIIVTNTIQFDRNYSICVYHISQEVSNSDTIQYNTQYTGNIPWFGKKTVKFKGTKDITIRLGSSLWGNGNWVQGIILTPKGDTLYSALNSNNTSVNEFKLPETGYYTINMETWSKSSYGYAYSCSFWLYQVDPLPVAPDTIQYDTQYTGNIPWFGKKTVKFKGTKDITIRLGSSLWGNGNWVQGIILTPKGDTLYSALNSNNTSVNEFKLPETGYYTINMETWSKSSYGYAYSCSFWLYQIFPQTKAITLELEKDVSSKIMQFAQPHIFQFSGAKNDLIYIKNFTSTSNVQMVFYDDFYQPIDTLLSNNNLILDKTLIREGIYYLVCTSTANSTTTFSFSFNLLPKYGVKSVGSDKVGNYGTSNIFIEGNGFSNNTKICLTKAGQDTIKADTLTFNRFKCSSLFNFNNKAKGKWDIIVNFGDTTVVLKEGLEVEDYKAPEVNVELIGSNYVRPNRYTYYTIFYNNTGNVNAYEIPISIQITSINEVDIEKGWDYYVPGPIDYYPIDRDVSNVSTNEETGKKTKTLMPTIPIISPNGEGTLTFGVKMNKSTEINVKAGSPMYYSNSMGNIVPNQDVFDCYSGVGKQIGGLLLNFGINAASEIIPGFGCATSFGSNIIKSQAMLASNKGTIDKPLVGNLVTNIMMTGADCALDFVPGENVIKALWEVAKVACDDETDTTIAACRRAFSQGKSNTISAKIVVSIDPNDKIGYRSPSGSRYYNEDVTNFTYIINFENKSTATAPAQEVFITDTLDMQSFDINSFRAGYIKIGSKIVQAPVNVQNNSWQIDMRPAMNLITNVELTLDKEKGIAHWYFKCIDPKTNDFPTDALLGFLPPNDSLGSGEGSVAFTINLKGSLSDTANISNRASIVFDDNAPILTPTWGNTKDIVAPTSCMNQPIIVSDKIATLSWNGEDNKNGSGLYTFNVYVKKNNEIFKTLLTNTTKDSIDFMFEKGNEYSFYVTATDSAGNTEIKTNVPDITLITSAEDITGLPIDFNLSQNYPNPFNPITIINYQLPLSSVVTLKIYNILGQEIATLVNEEKKAGYYKAIFNGSKLASGVYIYRIIAGSYINTKKMLLIK
jgi:hypothetical protein